MIFIFITCKFISMYALTIIFIMIHPLVFNFSWFLVFIFIKHTIKP